MVEEAVEQGRDRGRVSDELAPIVASGIRTGLESEQAAAGGDGSNVDYLFDIPVGVAKAVTRFRHDEDVEGAEPPLFEVLVADAPAGSRGRERRASWKKGFRE